MYKIVKKLDLKIPILAYLLCYTILLFGQAKGPTINFTNVSSVNGLSNNYVNDITQDTFGFIWIATTDGLCRYDSQDDFKIFQKGGELQLQSNNVRTLHLDSENKLWIGTRLGGLTCYNINNGTSKTYMHDPEDPKSISNNEILSIHEDKMGRIWVGTENGLNLFNSTTETFDKWLPDDSNENSIPESAVLVISEDSRGFIWVGTWAGGLSLLLNSDGQNVEDFSFRNFQLDSNTPALNVWSIDEDQDQRLWIGTHGGGLFFVDLPNSANNNSRKQNWDIDPVLFSNNNNPSLASNTVDHVFFDKQWNLWLATTTGLHFLDNNQVKRNHSKGDQLLFTSYKHDSKFQNTIIGNVTNKLFLDTNNTFWVGTINGLSKFTRDQSQIDFLPFNIKEDLNQLNNNFLVEKDSVLWVCGRNGGLFKLFTNDNSIERINVPGLPKDIELLTIVLEKDKYIIGGRGNVFEFDPKTKSLKQYTTPDKINKLTNSLYSRFLFIDDDGLIYISTEFGLVTLNRSKNEFKIYTHDKNDSESISDNSINKIYSTSDGTIWFATYKGLSKLISKDGGTLKFKSYLSGQQENEETLSSNQVICLEEVDGYLYIGTTSGLNKLDLKTEKITDVFNDKFKAYVISLESDKFKNIWLSTSEGITRYNTITKTYTNYDANDGIVDNTFRLITSNAGEGYLYFGSHNGISRVNITEDLSSKPPPKSYISEANLINNDKEIKLNLIGAEKLTLPSNNYYLALKYIGLEYHRMDKTKYAYKLEGFDEEWFYSNKNIPAVYTNLKPGDYIFKSKSANAEGVWSEKVAELKITKEPRFLEKPLVRFILLLLSISLLFSLISWYTSSIKKNNLQLQSFNDNLNKEIRERKKIEENLKKSNQDLQQFAYSASHDLQEPLRNIGNAVGLLQRKNNFDDNSNEFVDIAVDGVKRMSSLIENLLNYAKSGADAFSVEEVDLNLVVGEKLKDLSQLIATKNAVVDFDNLPKIICEPQQIGIVFFNLINNAIKFNKSEIPTVIIKHKEHQDYWKFYVTDNGIGIPEDYQNKIFSIFTRLENRRDFEGTGIGLSLCQKIVIQHNGHIGVESKLREGSTFHFTISKNLTS